MIEGYSEARTRAVAAGLTGEGVYWCDCCEDWGHHDDPCDCAYDLCRGLCYELGLRGSSESAPTEP